MEQIEVCIPLRKRDREWLETESKESKEREK